MSNLQRYEKEGIELLIDHGTGEVFASISGYARMANKSQGTISERLKSTIGKSNLPEVKAEYIDFGYGKKETKLIPEKLISQWIMRDNPELAEKMFEAGTRLFLYKLAGYRVGIKSDPEQMMEKMMSMLSTLTDEVKEMKEKVNRWDNLSDTTSDQYPGLKSMNDELSTKPIKQLSDGKLYTVNQWLDLNQITLNKSELHDFYTIVSNTYQSLKRSKPAKIEVRYDNGAKGKVNGYLLHDFFILQQALIKFRG